MATNISRSKKIFFWFCIVIFLYIFVELFCLVLLQIFHIKSSSYGYPNELFVYDEKLDFRYKPDFRGHFSGIRYRSVEIKINSLGFRDYEFELNKDPGIHRTLIVGNSITFGAGIALEDTYVKQTEKLLNSSGSKSYQLINCGVNAYHFEHYCIFIREYIDKISPDAIVIGFCINDLRPKEVSAPRHRVQKKSISGLIHALGQDLKRIIEKSPLYQISCYLIVSNPYGRKWYNSLWINQVMKSWKDDERLAKFVNMLDETMCLTEEKGVRLSIIIFPEMNQLMDNDKYGAPRDILLRILEELDIQYFDFYDTFKKKKDYSRYYLKGDAVHFTPEGHRVIAEELSKFLVKLIG